MSQEIVPNSKQETGWKGPEGSRWTKGRTTPNAITAEVRELAQRLLKRPRYLRTVLARMDAGLLHPMLEREIWHYAFGVPKEVKTGGQEDAGRTLADLLGPELLKAAYQASLSGVRVMALEPGNGNGNGHKEG